MEINKLTDSDFMKDFHSEDKSMFLLRQLQLLKDENEKNLRQGDEARTTATKITATTSRRMPYDGWLLGMDFDVPSTSPTCLGSVVAGNLETSAAAGRGSIFHYGVAQTTLSAVSLVVIVLLMSLF